MTKPKRKPTYRYRSSVTGRFVSAAKAKRCPRTTEKERSNG
jgi:predicted  nucleic acid-binding Zn ribbon protein